MHVLQLLQGGAMLLNALAQLHVELLQLRYELLPILSLLRLGPNMCSWCMPT